jgi:hypothetical protein
MVFRLYPEACTSRPVISFRINNSPLVHEQYLVLLAAHMAVKILNAEYQRTAC